MTQLRDAKGNQYTITSQLIAPTTFARYARQFPGGETELFEAMVEHECDETNEIGTGLAEWLFTKTDEKAPDISRGSVNQHE